VGSLSLGGGCQAAPLEAKHRNDNKCSNPSANPSLNPFKNRFSNPVANPSLKTFENVSADQFAFLQTVRSDLLFIILFHLLSRASFRKSIQESIHDLSLAIRHESFR
jgi:hypothetical protein